MPARDLYGEAAGLLRGSAQTAQGIMQDRTDKEKIGASMLQSSQANTGELVRAGMNNIGAMARQKDAQEADMITITEPLANGAATVTRDPAWKDLVGHKMRADVYSSILTHGVKQAAKPSYEKVAEGKEEVTYAVHDDGTKEEVGRGPRWQDRPDKKSGDDEKKLKDIDGKIKTDFATINRFLEKNKDIPREHSLFSYKFDKLTQKEQLQLTSLRASVNRLRQNLGNEQTLTKQAGLEVTDRSDVLGNLDVMEGMLGENAGASAKTPAPTGGADPDAQAKSWLQTNHPELKNPTPEDIAWAKGKMNG